MTMLSGRATPRVAAAVVGLLLVAALVTMTRGEATRTVSAVFPRTVSLFEGSDVRIMGIRVGTVTAITPQGTSVRVDMEYARKYDVPADAKAVIVSPSVISDRFVQLTPAYVGGERLAEGAVIAQEDTAVPVELDRTFEATQQLMDALGPSGANRHGALSGLLSVLADTLDGQGAELNGAITGVSDVVGTLGDHADDISGSITHLSSLSSRLADYDSDIEGLNTRLASVSSSLADNQDNISILLASLAKSLGEVGTFVEDNRESLSANVESLSRVATALDDERIALTQIVDIAPLAFTNLVNTYDPATKAVRTRANFAEVLRRADLAICSAIPAAAGDSADTACDLLRSIVVALPDQGGIGLPATPSADPTDPSQLPQLIAGLSGTEDLLGGIAGVVGGR
ncbi:MCE family protein [Aeromicrobium sp. A1-2]|uniref:MCE family protein n=1 Tax=Aeromicrobium sp. A1-2 TaxID=2107713 RepID=UPI0013C35082|nr:MCE family protein [Aeromicrobium sp. A1-2]